MSTCPVCMTNMKKLILIILFLVPSLAFAEGRGVLFWDEDCSAYTQRGMFCHDTTDNKRYYGTGSGIEELAVSVPASGYALNVQAITSSPADGATVYFGQLPKAPTTTANISKIYFPKNGTIKRAYIYVYAGTAGTNENWSLYIRLNNTSDTLIETIGAATSERIFNNESLNIAVTTSDYIEIKGIQPTWATNPLTTIYGGYIWIE